jgi:hypothetical protein
MHYASLGSWPEFWTAVALGLLASAGLTLALRRAPRQPQEMPLRPLSPGLVGGALCLVLVAAGVWAIGALVGDPWGEKLVFGAGDEVYFSNDATETEAQRFGQFLQDDGFFDRPTTSQVQLVRQGERVIVSFIVTREAWSDPQILASYRSMGDDISSRLFGGRHVEVRLCDERRMIQKKLN